MRYPATHHRVRMILKENYVKATKGEIWQGNFKEDGALFSKWLFASARQEMCASCETFELAIDLILVGLKQK